MFLIFNILLLESSEKNCVDHETNICVTLWLSLSPLVHLRENYVELHTLWDLNDLPSAVRRDPRVWDYF